jgi:Methyltransferase domain
MSSPNSDRIFEPRPQGWWERTVTPKLIGCCCAQPQIMKARSRIVPQADGDVLELGCGGGINMEFYDPARITSFAGLDPSPALLESSRKAAQAKGMSADIRAGIGEAMPFEDGQFDTLLVTFTLCSVDDQAQVLNAKPSSSNTAARPMPGLPNGKTGSSRCGRKSPATATSPAPSPAPTATQASQCQAGTGSTCPRRRNRWAGSSGEKLGFDGSHEYGNLCKWNMNLVFSTSSMTNQRRMRMPKALLMLTQVG